MKTTPVIGLCIVCSLMFNSVGLADTGGPMKAIGDYRIYYNTLHSMFIQPAFASEYKISRKDDQGLLNVAVMRKGGIYGEPAALTGSVKNVLGQKQTLKFDEIREGKAVYYIAQFTYYFEMPLEFSIQIEPEGTNTEHNLIFEETFYRRD